MQFDAELPFAHAITAYGAEGIAIQGQWYRQGVIVGADGLVLTWPVQLQNGQFTPADLSLVLEQTTHSHVKSYELVIVGTGKRQIFLPPDLLRPFIESGLPVECMNTPAACRTYNIVAAEGRRVLAALYPEV